MSDSAIPLQSDGTYVLLWVFVLGVVGVALVSMIAGWIVTNVVVVALVSGIVTKRGQSM